MLKAKLVIVGGRAKTKEIRLKLPTTIGRGKEADLTIPHALVSRSHSKLFERDGQLYVKDLGSLNGTFVDNKRIESEQIIAPNQLLTLGDITFRAVYEIDNASRETLSDNLIDSMQTLCSVKPMATAPSTPKPSADRTSDSQSNTEPVADIAKANLHRSAISEIDSFDPDEVGSLDTPSMKTGPPPITPNQSSHDQTSSQKTITETPINFISNELTDDQPIAQTSAIDIDLNLPDDDTTVPVSSIEKIQTDDDSPSAIDDFQINLGDDAPQSDIDNSQLGSFLKKFPK